ncbi:MAG: hypothetical protein IKD00_01795 [Candidatus Methanomethylophilaceae archaeon]|nr:hypothetical protein [Candidatus Methanomethylophilaceae archaeon]
MPDTPDTPDVPDTPDNPNANDGVFNYVSIGASNTNGYGMRGYMTEQELAMILSGAVDKDDVNVYGYQRTPEGAYPDLIRDHFVGIHGADNVKVNQLAISSMRVEEVRILLDDTYMGDDYSQWRFTGSDGWFISAEDGGLESLRLVYRNSITSADLITVDIGWNNFGVYICNQLVDYLGSGSYMWTTDVESIFDTPAEKAAALEAKAIIGAYIGEYVEDEQMCKALTDIFAYSLIGYMHNFDIVMDEIYTLNPYADVVVVGIQNLLHGVIVKVGGQDVPLGDIFGNFVNMANYYASSCSPHHDDYLYIKPGIDGHVNIFLDQMRDYDGDAENLNQNVKDSFDYYDDNLYLQSTVDNAVAQMLEENIPQLLNGMSGSEFIQKGKNNQLGIIAQPLFNSIYWPTLYAAYDTLATLVKEIANTPSIDGDALLNGLDIDAEENQLKDAVMNEVIENATAAAQGQGYTVDIEKMLPDEEAVVVASIYVRFYLGNSFYAHPDETGHNQIKTGVVEILGNPESEKEQELKTELAESVHNIHQLLCGGSGHQVQAGVCTICGTTGITA